MSDGMQISVVEGVEADALMGGGDFVEQWNALMQQCPWATAFQGPGFARTWYGVYRQQFDPVLVIGRDAEGKLAGMLALAASPDRRKLAAAGAHHAEYQAWICRPEAAETFPWLAMRAIQRLLPPSGLRLHYLPAEAPTGWVNQGEAARFCLLKTFDRPLLKFGDGSETEKSLSKSGNKSRLRQMKKLGAVSFVKLSGAAELEPHFDEITRFFDARNLAVHSSTPFESDPLKHRCTWP